MEHLRLAHKYIELGLLHAATGLLARQEPTDDVLELLVELYLRTGDLGQAQAYVLQLKSPLLRSVLEAEIAFEGKEYDMATRKANTARQQGVQGIQLARAFAVSAQVSLLRGDERGAAAHARVGIDAIGETDALTLRGKMLLAVFEEIAQGKGTAETKGSSIRQFEHWLSAKAIELSAAAEEQVEQGNWDRALSLCEEAIRFAPASLELACRFARMALDASHFEKSAFFLRRALRIAPKSKIVWREVAEFLLRTAEDERPVTSPWLVQFLDSASPGTGHGMERYANSIVESVEARAQDYVYDAVYRYGHQVKNSLSVLGARAQRVTKKPDKENIQKIADGLMKLYEEWTLFLRTVESPQTTLTPVDLVELLREMERDGVELSGAKTAVVEGERVLLAQGLENLIGNGLEAGAPVRVFVEDSPHEVSIVIQDGGPGIPSHMRKKVFERTFTTKEQGNGMGLPIAKRAIEAHGGTLTLVTAESQGATFQLRIPKNIAYLRHLTLH